MPWAGGTFTRSNGVNSGSDVWTQDKNAGVKITSARHDAHDQDAADGINACLNRDGSNAMTAALPMGTNRITSLGAATARTDAIQAAQVQDGGVLWGGTSGGTNAITIGTTPAITAYVAGMHVRWIAGLTISGAATLNINGVGAIALRRGYAGGEALAASEIIAGQICGAIFDGTVWRLLTPYTGPVSWDPAPVSAGLTIANVSTTFAYYRRRGKTVDFHFRAAVDVTGNGVAINFTLPVTAGGSSYAAGAGVIQNSDGNYRDLIVVPGTTTLASLFVDGGGNIMTTTANGRVLIVWGTVYEG